MVEGLFVDGVDRHLCRSEQAGIIEGPDLYDHGGKSLWPRREVRSAFGAEFAGHRPFKVAPPELLGRVLGVLEACNRHGDEEVWRTTGDVLALATMTLRLHHRLALGEVAHLAAIAPARKFHGALPNSWPRARPPRGRARIV